MIRLKEGWLEKNIFSYTNLDWRITRKILRIIPNYFDRPIVILGRDEKRLIRPTSTHQRPRIAAHMSSYVRTGCITEHVERCYHHFLTTRTRSIRYRALAGAFYASRRGWSDTFSRRNTRIPLLCYRWIVPMAMSSTFLRLITFFCMEILTSRGSDLI